MAKDRLNFCVFGAGRIGKLHARNLAVHPRARVSYVVDPVARLASDLAREVSAATAPDAAAALADREVDAVVVASSTNTHVDLIAASARAGKAVLCEKPIDLDIRRVDRCLAELKKHRVPVAIGFNRRFDPTNRAIEAAIGRGEVGEVEQIVITSRDPAPPPLAYIKSSGGLLRDMTIHDFDMARYLAGDIIQVHAFGANLVDPKIAKLGDIDTCTVSLRSKSGALLQINNSRRCVYGYDQRIEAFGATGQLRAGNQRATTVEYWGAERTSARDPVLNFFIERYAEAYRAELDAFIESVAEPRSMSPDFSDGLEALRLAVAAEESLRTFQVVDLS